MPGQWGLVPGVLAGLRPRVRTRTASRSGTSAHRHEMSGNVRSAGVEETRTKLPSLLEAANRGTVTVVTKRGVPYAAIVPVSKALA